MAAKRVVTPRSIWTFKDRQSGEIVDVRVSSTFITEDGTYASLRHPGTDLPLGNAPVGDLIARVRPGRGR